MTDRLQESEIQIQSARRELYEIYSDFDAKPRQKRKLIERLDEIYGYDLAFLVGLIMRSEFSGNLNIINRSNEISGISFSKGKITKIDLNDKETFMGELLIKDGYLTREKLLELLLNATKPLGEILIINKIVTRDQIVSVLIKQMRLRLSKYINNNKYRLNFSESEILDTGLSISYTEYLGLAHDWVAGRFSGDWLRLHYLEFSEGVIDTPLSTLNESFTTLPLSIDLLNILKSNLTERSFSKIFSVFKSEKEQDYFLKCFHYGIMTRQILLNNNPNVNIQTESILKNIYAACNKKKGTELVETLAHILKFKPTEIDSIFQSVNNYVHSYNGDDLEIKNNMFRLVLEMLSKKQFYTDEINKKYLNSTEYTQSTELINKISEVYTDLLNKNIFEAVDKIKKISEHSANTPKIKLYMVWAKALMAQQNNIKINIAELDRDFFQILPEDKDTAEYYYVKSILYSLKKDDVSAAAAFKQSIQLNNQLKNFPPFKQTGSFIKNLLKLSFYFLFFSSQLISVVSFADNKNGGLVQKTKLPFVFLNQYFNYKIIEDEKIQINDTIYDLSDMLIETKTDSINIELKSTLDTFKKSASFGLYSMNTKKMTPIKFVLLEEKYTINLNSANNDDFICLLQNNQYTNMKFCKALNKIEQKGLKSFTANNQAIEPEGTIILNDQAQKINFNVTKNNNDFFNLETIKRSILPSKVDKSSNSDDLKIQFIDSGNTRFGWEDNISLNQNYFLVKFDDLISLKQGIFFNSTISNETGLSQVYIDKDKLQKKYYNKLILEPLVAFDEVIGKSNTMDAILRSGLGYGVALSYDHYLDNGQNIFGSIGFYTTKMSPTTNTAIILDPATSIIQLSAGYKYSLTEKLSLVGTLKIQEDMFFNQVNSSTVVLTKSINKLLGLGAEYTFYNKLNWTILADLAGFGILPTDVKNTTTTSFGILLDANLKASYKVNWGKISAGLDFGNRSQKNDTYTYSGSYLLYKLGLNYLF